MHELLSELFPYLVGFYLLDGIAAVRRGHLLLSSGPGGRFEVVPAGLHLVGIWPACEAIAAHDLLLLPSAEALHILDPAQRYEPRVLAASDLRRIPWAEMGPLEVEGRKLRMGGKLLLRAHSSLASRRTRAWIGLLAAAAAGERPAIVAREVEEASDLDAVRGLRRRQAPFLPWLKLLAGSLFAGLFLVLPALLFTDAGRVLSLRALLLALAAAYAAVLGVGATMLLRCGVRPGGVLAAVSPMLLFPGGAAHALIHLSREIYGRFAPASLAAVLLDRATLQRFARWQIQRIRFSHAAAGGELEPFWNHQERAWDRILDAIGLARDAVLAAPPAEAGSARYCPICATQYREGFERCTDCNIPLADLDPSPAHG